MTFSIQFAKLFVMH